MQSIKPNWKAPQNVKAFTTLRHGGVSLAPYESFNLGDHVGDDKNAVKINRTLLVEKFHLPQMPLFLNQTHSTRVLTLPYDGDDINADAVYTNQPNQVCLVMTADCLPVLFTNKQGSEVAAAHAGWRGLCDGVLEQTVAKFHCPPEDILAWFGPAIGPTAFQVGQEVIDQFVAQNPPSSLIRKRETNSSATFTKLLRNASTPLVLPKSAAANTVLILKQTNSFLIAEIMLREEWHRLC